VRPYHQKNQELGDEPSQLCRLVDTIEACLRRTQKEAEQATHTLKQVQGDIIEQRKIVEQEKVNLKAKFEVEKAQMQQEKE
jgi:hypothetical protein